MRGFFLVAKSAVLALFLCLVAIAAPAAEMPTEPLVIRRASGGEVAFTVELAVTPEQREQGLMNRDAMADDHGMLFDFGFSRRAFMWMKNTYLPLDMLFIAADGRILHIAADALPLSETIIDSRHDIRFVLEINGGLAERHGIAVADRVDSPAIRAASAP